MLKFFRRIRQKLLAQHKTGQYLKYAAGEIVLVVIGILVALQINGWNERRNDQLAKEEAIFDLLRWTSLDFQEISPEGFNTLFSKS